MQLQLTTIFLTTLSLSVSLFANQNQNSAKCIQLVHQTGQPVEASSPLDELKAHLKGELEKALQEKQRKLVAAAQNPSTLTPEEVKVWKENARLAIEEYLLTDGATTYPRKIVPILEKVVDQELDPFESPEVKSYPGLQVLILDITNASMATSRGVLNRKAAEIEEPENAILTLADVKKPKYHVPSGTGLKGAWQRVKAPNINFSSIEELAAKLESLNLVQRLRALKKSVDSDNIHSLSLEEAITILQVFKGVRQYLAYRIIAPKIFTRIKNSNVMTIALGLDNAHIRVDVIAAVFEKDNSDFALNQDNIIGFSSHPKSNPNLILVLREILENTERYSFTFDINSFLREHAKWSPLRGCYHLSRDFKDLSTGVFRHNYNFDIPKSKQSSLRRWWQRTKLVGAITLGGVAVVGVSVANYFDPTGTISQKAAPPLVKTSAAPNRIELTELFRQAEKKDPRHFLGSREKHDNVLLEYFRAYKSELFLLEVAQLVDRAVLVNSSYEIILQYLQARQFQIPPEEFSFLIKGLKSPSKHYFINHDMYAHIDSKAATFINELTFWYNKNNPGKLTSITLQRDPEITATLRRIISSVPRSFERDQRLLGFFMNNFKKLQIEDVVEINKECKSGYREIILGWLKGHQYKIPLSELQALLEKDAFRPEKESQSIVREAAAAYFKNGPKDKETLEAFIKWYLNKNPHYDQTLIEYLRSF